MEVAKTLEMRLVLPNKVENCMLVNLMLEVIKLVAGDREGLAGK